MKMPAWVNKWTFWGMAWGVVLTIVLGFTYGDWTLGSTAQRMAERKANEAVVSVLAPVCVDRFKKAPEAAANLVALQKESEWRRGDLVAKLGFATIGGKEPNDGVAKACAEALARGLKK